MTARSTSACSSAAALIIRALMSFLSILRFVWRTYRRYSWRHRVHVLIRALTCPFQRMLDVIPAGRILEVGAGHGIYCYLAARDASRRVFALEPDLRKTMHDEHAPGVRWVAGYD